MIIGLPTNAQGIGDLMTITPICKQVPDCVVQLPPSSKKFSRIFRDIAEVRYADNPRQIPIRYPLIKHWSILKMESLGLPTGDYYPYLSVSQQDLDRGKQLLSGYKNPIAFVSNCSKQWSHIRQFSQDQTQYLVDKLAEYFTVIQFGVSNNIMELKNVVPMHDLPLDDLISCYAVIGRYVGVSTGDLFLMLGAGGETLVHIPPGKHENLHNLWNYDYDRAVYVYDDPDKVVNLAREKWYEDIGSNE